MNNHFLGIKNKAALAVMLGLLLFQPLVGQAQEETATSTEAATSTTAETSETNGTDTVPESGAAMIGSAQIAEERYERAIVEEVRVGSKTTDSGGEQVEIYTIRFLSGPLKDEMREIQSSVASNPYQLEPKQGDKVVVFMQQSPTNQEWDLYLEGFDRRAALIWLVVIFFLSLILLSGWQGVKVFLSIGISIALIGFVLIPLFLKGIHPVPTAIVLMGLMAFISTGLSTGWNKVSLITALGTMGGALIAYALATLFVDWANLSGINSTDEDRIFFRDNPNLNPRGLLFAGIIIAAAGAAEDVAVSIASGAREVKKANPNATFKDVFTSAMIVGKDHMAALANTLIFAYVGASLSTLLLYTQFDASWLKFINFDIVADEVIRALTGTIGITFTVPITAALAAWVVLRDKASGKRTTRNARLR